MGSPAAVLLALRGTPFGRYVLAVHRADGRGWALPGGYIERGESAEAAARREAYEETRMRAGGVMPLLVEGNVTVFEALEIAGEPRGSIEGAAAWVPAAWVLEGPFGALADRALARVTFPTTVLPR